jgi:hypothetical protein
LVLTPCFTGKQFQLHVVVPDELDVVERIAWDAVLGLVVLALGLDLSDSFSQFGHHNLSIGYHFLETFQFLVLQSMIDGGILGRK